MTPRVVRVHEADENTVYIGRGSIWGNPYKIGPDGSRDDVIRKYGEHLSRHPELVARARVDLRGKHLACYCAPKACHGDVLLALANVVV